MDNQCIRMTVSQNGRLAGLIYLLVVLTGIFSLAYVPSQIIVWDSALDTVKNILDNDFLFRAGIVSGILCYVFFSILPLCLYKLLSPVNRSVARLMVILALVSVPVSIYNLTVKLDILSLLRGYESLAASEANAICDQVLLMLTSYNNGVSIVLVFWGLWLFPFGYLVCKSCYIPKIFGFLLMFGCFGYLVQFSMGILFPSVNIPSFVKLPAPLAEIGTCLWLMIMGAKGDSVKR